MKKIHVVDHRPAPRPGRRARHVRGDRARRRLGSARRHAADARVLARAARTRSNASSAKLQRRARRTRPPQLQSPTPRRGRSRAIVYRRPPPIVVVKHTHHGDDGSSARAEAAAMTSHTGRLYALALALVVFFLAWAAIAARPGSTRTRPTRGSQRSPSREAAAASARATLVDSADRSRSARSSRRVQAARRAARARRRPRRRAGARREPAAADDHEDVVIEPARFRAMGTDIELLVDADDAERALDAAEDEFHRLEALLSRFRADSELSRLNATGALEAGPDLARVVALALEARERTGGRFDPTVHDALVAAGYDRTFEQVAAGRRAAARRAAPCGGGVAHRRRRASSSTPGVRLDLGGIGKGYAAERAAELLALAGPCLVNAGGDIAVRGGALAGRRRRDGIDARARPAARSPPPAATGGAGGAAARELHHLIDPATGAPAETDLLRVTVVAADAVEAEVLAKALFLAGSSAPREADAGVACVLVTADGRTRLAGGPRMTHDPTFWILARASGLTAYVLLTLSRARRARRQVAAVRPRASRRPRSTDVHRFLALLGARRARAPRASRSCSTRPCTCRSRRSLVPGLAAYRPRRGRRSASLAAELMVLIVALVPAAQADRRRATGAGCTGRPTRVFALAHRPRPRRRDRHRRGRGPSASTSARSAPSPSPPPGAALTRPRRAPTHSKGAA